MRTQLPEPRRIAEPETQACPSTSAPRLPSTRISYVRESGSNSIDACTRDTFMSSVTCSSAHVPHGSGAAAQVRSAPGGGAKKKSEPLQARCRVGQQTEPQASCQ